MFLNSENKKIIEYLLLNNLSNYADAYLKLLATGLKIDKNEFKKIIKLVKSNNSIELSKNLLEIFLKFKIDIKNNSSSSNERVKKYRENIKAKGYKNIALQLPPGVYQKLRLLKIKHNMTYSELIAFLISDIK